MELKNKHIIVSSPVLAKKSAHSPRVMSGKLRVRAKGPVGVDFQSEKEYVHRGVVVLAHSAQPERRRCSRLTDTSNLHEEQNSQGVSKILTIKMKSSSEGFTFLFIKEC